MHYKEKTVNGITITPVCGEAWSGEYSAGTERYGMVLQYFTDDECNRLEKLKPPSVLKMNPTTRLPILWKDDEELSAHVAQTEACAEISRAVADRRAFLADLYYSQRASPDHPFHGTSLA